MQIWGELCSGQKLLAQFASTVCKHSLQAQSVVSSQRLRSAYDSKSGQGEGQSVTGFPNRVYVCKLHCSANACESTAKHICLTAQAFLFSRASLSMQRGFDTPCVKPLVACTQLRRRKWKLQSCHVHPYIDVDQQGAMLPVSCACRTAAKSRLCFQPWSVHTRASLLAWLICQ